MREIFEKLYDLMDGRKIIVMPSEDARRRLLSSYALSRKRTVSASLAISTDTFISLFFPDRDAKPIDQATRLSFSSYLLFSKRELLPYFVPPSLSQELLPRMVRFIASLLPHLEDDGIVPFKKAIDDLGNIKKEYMLFLERMNLYEPSFISGGVELDGPYVLFHPECNLPLSSFLKKAGKLGLLGDGISTLSIPGTFDGKMYVYPNEMMEVRSTMRMVRHLLDSGVKQDEIALSLPDPDALGAYIEREARLFSFPVIFQRGKCPLEYPVGALLKSVREMKEDDFSISSLKLFFLNPAFPFKDLSSCRLFLKRAIAHSVTRRKENDDRYLEVDVNGVYRTLLHYVLLITGAKDPDELSDGIMGLMERFFGRNAFLSNPEDAPLVSFMISRLSELRNLISKAKDAGYSIKGNIFSLFMTILESSVYVPQERKMGVRILKLGDAVGEQVSYHFLMALNEKEGVYSIASSPFLSDFEIVGKRNDDERLSYLLSSYNESATHLVISSSVETFRGNMLPSMAVERCDVSLKEGTSVSEMLSDILRRKDEVGMFLDEYTQERPSLSGKTHGLYAFPLQIEGLNRALLSSLDTEKIGYGSSLAWGKPGRGGNDIRVYSYSQIDRYRECPYSYYLFYRLSLSKSAKYKSDEYPFLEVGTRLHSVMEMYFSKKERNTEDIGKLLSEELDMWQKRLGRDKRTGDVKELGRDVMELTPLLRAYIESRYKEPLVKLATILEEMSQGGDIAVEKKVSGDILSHRFEAYIDFLFESADSAFILDFKTSSAPKGKLQFDVYRALLGIQGLDAYYALFSKGTLEKTELLDDEMFSEAVSAFFEGLDKGDFHATKDSTPCSSCAFRGICRRRFFIQ